MNPILADAINFPFVLAVGLAVAVPLLLFQVGVEGFVLSRSWALPFHELWRFVFRANVMSLLAGIPTKIANLFIYAAILPKEIPHFFERYPFAVSVGTLAYFAVTIVVEGWCGLRWRNRDSVALQTGQLWRGILWANIATYLVMAPLHYYVTRPRSDVREYTANVSWTRNPDTRLVFIDPKTKHLKTKALSETDTRTVVEQPMEEFLISSNLDLCLYRGTNDFLYLWRKEPLTNSLVWEAHERVPMDEVAFSPSGALVAFIYDKRSFIQDEGSGVEVVDLVSGRRTRRSLTDPLKGLWAIAWTTNENRLVMWGNSNRHWVITIRPDLDFGYTQVENMNEIQLMPCYGRTFSSGWSGSSHMRSECGERRLFAVGGLGSSIRIYNKDDVNVKWAITVAVNPGLLHLSRIGFRDATFMEGCEECLIGTWEHIYLLDIEKRRLGTVCEGGPYITITPRFLKGFGSR